MQHISGKGGSLGLTVRVDDGQDVEVVVVQSALHESVVVLVAQNKLVGEILDRLCNEWSACDVEAINQEKRNILPEQSTIREHGRCRAR